MDYHGPVYGIGDGPVIRDLRTLCFELLDVEDPSLRLTLPLRSIRTMKCMEEDRGDQVIRLSLKSGKQLDVCLTSHAVTALRDEWEKHLLAATA